MARFVRVAYKGTVPGNPVQICGLRFTVDQLGPLTAGQLLTMANAAETVLEAAATRALYGTDFFLGLCAAQEYERIVPPPPAPPFFSPVSLDIVSDLLGVFGTNLGQTLPAQNAFVVSFKTLLPGRRRIGRNYTFSPPETVVNALGIVSDANGRRDRVVAIASAVEASLAPIDVDHIVHSVTGGDVNEVTSYVVGGRIDTLRGRLAKE